MTLAEFLIHLLQAQGETLQKLAALLGEENLISILELAGERGPAPHSTRFTLEAFGAPEPGPKESRVASYPEIEGAVHDLHLPAPLEFHLWAYPSYRALIESPLDLEAWIPGPGGDAGPRLVEQALSQAQGWVENLGLPEPFATQARRVAHFSWLRFRTVVLKRIGKRPVGPVY